MPGTGTANGPGSIRCEPKLSWHIEIMDTSNVEPHNPSIQLLRSVFHFEKCSRISNTCCLLCFGKCSRISNMPGTGTANGPGSIRCEPKLSWHIEIMDTSNVATPNSISTSSVLFALLWEVFKNQQHAWHRYSELSRQYSLGTNLSCHIEIMDTSNVGTPNSITTSSVLFTLLLEVFKNQQHAWHRYSEWSRQYSL